MRIIIDLDEDILRSAKQIARDNQSLGRVLSDLARKGLRTPPPSDVTIRNGVVLLPGRPGARPVTSEHVKELLELDD